MIQGGLYMTKKKKIQDELKEKVNLKIGEAKPDKSIELI